MNPPRSLPGWLTARPIAHRGLHALPDAPENSLAAFAAAIAAGHPIELDVRPLADGQLAVFHDPDLQRLTGTSGPIRTRSTEDIRDLRLLGTNEHVPLLPETLDFVAGRVPLLIEIKADDATVGPLEQATLQALSGYPGAFAIQSFRAATVTYLAEHAPEIVRGQLASNDNWRGDAADPDFLAYSIESLPTPLSSALRAGGRALLCWTIRTPEQQRRAAALADNYIFEAISP
jgi:glycerophosphoryl diester phosphodiesterase